MARPRKSEHLRLQLLDTGCQLLNEQGYHGTGIKPLLQAVGIAKGSFYNFFPSKEAFVASAIYRYGEQMANEFEAALTGYEQAPAIVQIWMSFHNKVCNRATKGEPFTCLMGAMSAEIAQANRLCSQAIDAVMQQWLDRLEVMVINAQQQGDLREDLASRVIAIQIYNAWQGCLLYYQVSNDIDALLAQLKNLIFVLATSQGQATLNDVDV